MKKLLSILAILGLALMAPQMMQAQVNADEKVKKEVKKEVKKATPVRVEKMPSVKAEPTGTPMKKQAKQPKKIKVQKPVNASKAAKPTPSRGNPNLIYTPITKPKEVKKPKKKPSKPKKATGNPID